MVYFLSDSLVQFNCIGADLTLKCLHLHYFNHVLLYMYNNWGAYYKLLIWLNVCNY